MRPAMTFKLASTKERHLPPDQRSSVGEVTLELDEILRTEPATPDGLCTIDDKRGRTFLIDLAQSVGGGVAVVDLDSPAE